MTRIELFDVASIPGIEDLTRAGQVPANPDALVAARARLDAAIAAEPTTRTAATPDAPTRNSGRRRRGWIGATAGIAVLVAGVGTAAAWVGRVEPTVRDTARCFAIATTEFGDLGRSGEAYADLSVILVDAGTGEIVDRDQTPQRAIEGCAKSWQSGRLAGTKPYQRVASPWGVGFEGPPRLIYPVPRLVACVLPTGQVGVFPDTDCAALGLPEADLD
jgi:hypothetical protein